MITARNIYDFQLLERDIPVYINNQKIKMMRPMNNDWLYIITDYEMVIVRSEKKLKTEIVPFKNDAKWS